MINGILKEKADDIIKEIIEYLIANNFSYNIEQFGDYWYISSNRKKWQMIYNYDNIFFNSHHMFYSGKDLNEIKKYIDKIEYAY